MKNKKRTVTIGIPAFNEEANIGYLLESLIKQKEEDFKIDKIIISSDGSTDRTVEVVKSVKDSRIKLLDNKKRRGQANRQNQLVKLATSDIFVLLEADTLPANNYFLKNLLQPMMVNKKHNIGIIFGNSIPLNPKSFFENIMYFKAALKGRIFLNYESKSWVGASGHRGRAFSKKLVKKISWVDNAPEDTYSFLLCKQIGHEIVYAPKAKIYHRLPVNFKDYYRQYTKFIRGRQALLQYFSQNEIVELNNYKFPISASINELIKAVIKNPLMMFLYMCTLLMVHLRNLRKENFDPLLDVYMSTKKLKI